MGREARERLQGYAACHRQRSQHAQDLHDALAHRHARVLRQHEERTGRPFSVRPSMPIGLGAPRVRASALVPLRVCLLSGVS